jgi:membrane fusion protein (multidrug efflux system)
LAARLIGTVTEVLVEEHSRVKQGQLLIRLDPRDAQTRRDQSEAKLAETRAALAAAETGVIHAQDNARLNDIALDKARLDLERMRGLTGGARTSVSRQDLDHAQAAYDTASASVVASLSAVDVAKAEIVVARAKESSAAAALQEAILQCEYTTIRSPVDGRVGRRNVETGQPVIPAQPLIALVGDDLWLTANFKETQISSISAGQAALIRFDAFPGREWPGTVESLSPASGARFALLPPDNATGNFTRVVQRLPVRIRIHQSALRELGPRFAPGLSAKVRVRVGAGLQIETAPTLPATLTSR